MDNIKIIHAPIITKEIENLKAGDIIYLSGTILTGRDAAHKRMVDLLKSGEPLPVDIKNQVMYYAGPCPAKPGHPIGSCGPTTSSRVDVFTPYLLEAGLKAMIGKGERSPQVIQSMIKNKAVYFAATGGAGALIAKCVKRAQVIAFADLGTEAVHKFVVENFPLITAIDIYGNNLYEKRG